MKMQSVREENREGTIETSLSTHVIACVAEEPQIVRDAGEIDDRKTPLVFDRLWRECLSVFTLAFAPGLNVSHLTFSV
jgi:hypothetical protein